MKLKLKAEGKDWFVFILFCIFLLYFIAIIVSNVYSFTSYDELSGLNPLLAFNEAFVLTMIIYISMLILVFSSVSSYFFETEKGVGVSFGRKKEKGYSTWATVKEIKKEAKLVKILPKAERTSAAGVPLINNGKEIWVDDSEYHSLVIGSTGSGKTEMLVQPMVKNLAKNDESMIITDPKGEIYENNAEELRKRGYNIVLLNFREPQKGNCWNPLSLPYNLYKNGDPDKANELLDDLAKNILYDENNKSNDPFWENTAADYFAGLSLALFDDAKESEINLNSINLMSTVGEEKIGISTYMKEYFSTKDQTSPAYVNAASTLLAPNETKGSILAVFKQKIKLFSSRQNLSEMLSKSDFDMEDIGRKKTAVFIVIQDEKKTYHSLVTIFLKQCYETLIRVAQESGGKLPYRTNFILDEFANMPPLKDITTMITAARSRKIRFTFIIQNFAQLNEVYGKENAETIKGNCGNIIYLISSEIAALEEISKMCGEVKSKKDDKTSSTPLVTVSDLQRMKFGSIILLRTRCMPFKTNLMPNFEMLEKQCWAEVFDKADYPSREKEAIAVFDIKKVVDAIRKEKMDNMFKNTKSKSGVSPQDMFKKGGANTKDKSYVDEMIKRIDKQIAELEKQEEEEKVTSKTKGAIVENKTAEEEKITTNNKDSVVKEVIAEKEKSKPIKIIMNKEVLEEEEKETDEIDISDDQFFDDFFSEEE